MMPTIKSPDPELASLLRTYHEAGGVVDYVLFDPVNSVDADDKVLHQAAAVEALKEIDRRMAADALEWADRTGRDIAEFPRISFEPEKIAGRAVTKEAFIGPCFRMDAGTLIIRGGSDAHLNDYFPVGAPESPDQVVQIPRNGDYSVNGYAQAFSEPPYPMRMGRRELNALFIDIYEAAIGTFDDPLAIYDWAGEWSTYFEPGFEWWGAYLWTVCNRKDGRLAAIGASATD